MHQIVDQTVILCLFGAEVAVAVAVFADFPQIAAGVAG